jgi:heme oxygenase
MNTTPKNKLTHPCKPKNSLNHPWYRRLRKWHSDKLQKQHLDNLQNQKQHLEADLEKFKRKRIEHGLKERPCTVAHVLKEKK